MGIVITQKGSFKNTEKFLNKLKNFTYRIILERYGILGVEKLREYTPKDTGKTAASWRYEIVETDKSLKVVWKNDNIVDNVNIAIILQYGHATRNGGYVQGTDYINPALKKIFEDMAEDVWKEVIEA